MYGSEKKKIKEAFSKIGCQLLLSKENILGHPCVPRVRVTRAGDKGRSLRSEICFPLKKLDSIATFTKKPVYDRRPTQI
jgi:hypothetical protein